LKGQLFSQQGFDVRQHNGTLEPLS
jgi:hypothetical protein